jgi:hypothetical protein
VMISFTATGVLKKVGFKSADINSHLTIHQV